MRDARRELVAWIERRVDNGLHFELACYYCALGINALLGSLACNALRAVTSTGVAVCSGGAAPVVTTSFAVSRPTFCRCACTIGARGP